jgi:hypothetical protein
MTQAMPQPLSQDVKRIPIERHDLFATPVVVFDVPGMDALNRDLVARLLEEEESSPGVQRANHGGWHSEMTLNTRPEACFRELMKVFLDYVGKAVALLSRTEQPPLPVRLRLEGAWAMVMRHGDCATIHGHGHVPWALAYYPDAGDLCGDQSGCLAFSDPSLGVRPVPELGLFPPLFTIEPRTSTLVVFPGWLRHQVYTYEGQRPRISVSSNVIMEFAAEA